MIPSGAIICLFLDNLKCCLDLWSTKLFGNLPTWENSCPFIPYIIANNRSIYSRSQFKGEGAADRIISEAGCQRYSPWSPIIWLLVLPIGLRVAVQAGTCKAPGLPHMVPAPATPGPHIHSMPDPAHIWVVGTVLEWLAWSAQPQSSQWGHHDTCSALTSFSRIHARSTMEQTCAEVDTACNMVLKWLLWDTHSMRHLCQDMYWL